MSTSTPSGSGYSGGKSGNPPNLAHYGSGPRYDLATIVDLVGLRPMTLWNWEQQLGIPAPTRLNDEVSTVRRYSEQDLIACIWIRDQILNGVSPIEAATRLRAAQQQSGGDESWAEQPSLSRPGEDTLGPGRVNTGPLSTSSFGPRRAPSVTRPLSDLDALPADPRASFTGSAPHGPASSSSGPGGTRTAGASQVWVSPLSGPLGQRIVSGPLGTPITSGPLGGAVAPGLSVVPMTSGPHSQVGASAAHPTSSYDSSGAGVGRTWRGTGGNPATAPAHNRDPRTLLPQFMRALVNLDTEAANRVVKEAIDAGPLETMGTSLLQPAISRIAGLYAHHDITAFEEHFAMSYLRGLLYATFRNTPENPIGPLVFIGCCPRELDDMPALLLAVYWRRAGMRVVYLGQDVDGDSLVEVVRQRRPTLVCLSASASPRVRALARICKHIAQLEKQRPVFTFAGPVFARNPELQQKVAGVYVGDDAGTATWHVMKLLGMDHR